MFKEKKNISRASFLPIVVEKNITREVKQIFSTLDGGSGGQLARRSMGGSKSKIRGVILFFIVLGVTSFYFFGKSIFKEKLIKKLDFLSADTIYSVNSYLPIYASPVLFQTQTGKMGFTYADVGGNVYATVDGTLRYHFRLGESVLSALLSVEVDGSAPQETLVVGSKGTFYTLNQNGDYFYKSREEAFNESIFAKPARWKDMLFFAGMKGSIWAADSRYGEILWKKVGEGQAGEEILAAPLLVGLALQEPPKLVVAQLNGTVSMRDGRTGKLLWKRSLPAEIKAALTVGDFFPEKPGQTPQLEIVAGTLSGEVFLLASATGDIKKKIALPSFKSLKVNQDLHTAPLPPAIISSISKGQIRNSASEKEGIFFVALTQDGVAHIVHFSKKPGNIQDTLENFAITSIPFPQETFLASPIVADFNRDKDDDVLAVARSGKGYLINVAEKSFTPLFNIGYNITATPLVADLTGDNHLEVVLCGEDGQVKVLTLLTTPKSTFPKGIIISGEFLKNSLNQN